MLVFEPGDAAWLHPGQSATVLRGGTMVGRLGAVHPERARALGLESDVYAFELDVESIQDRPIPRAEALGYDARIGRRFLSPGLGFGGGCLPKDIRAFRATAADLGVDSVVSLLTAVDAINQGRRDRVIALARAVAGGTLAGTVLFMVVSKLPD